MLRLRRSSAGYLDLDFRIGSNLRARVVERPGRWMTPADRSRIVGDLQAVVASAVDRGVLDYGVVAADKERLDDAVLTVLYEAGRPVAFNAMSIMTIELYGRVEDVLHLGLVVVRPDRRNKGFSWVLSGLSVLLIAFHRQLRPMWISSVTQVPAIVGMVANGLSDVYPTANGARRSYSHLVIARQIMSRYRHVFGVGEEAGFDFDRFIITNAYTGGSDNLKKTYAACPKYRDEAYNRMCREELDYERGDDYLQLGKFTVANAKNYLLRTVPRRSLAAVLCHGAFLVAGSLLLPVVRWFTPRTAMGDLRPWKSPQ